MNFGGAEDVNAKTRSVPAASRMLHQDECLTSQLQRHKRGLPYRYFTNQ